MLPPPLPPQSARSCSGAQLPSPAHLCKHRKSNVLADGGARGARQQQRSGHSAHVVHKQGHCRQGGGVGHGEQPLITPTFCTQHHGG